MLRHHLWLACASALFLVACLPDGQVPSPTGKLASKTIDAQGGTITTDNGVRIAIPPDALFEQVEIAITGLGTIAPPAGTTAIGGGYLFEPESVYFSVPAKVTLPVAGPYPEGTLIMVGRQHGEGAEWELLAGELTDTGITVETHSFSRWVAVRVDPNAADAFRSAEHVNWTRQFGVDPADEVTGLAVAPDDTVLVAGRTYGGFEGFKQGGNGDAFLRKYNAEGEVLWTRQFGFGSTEHAYAVTTDAAGTIYVAGQALHLLDEGSEDVDYTRAGGAFVRTYRSDGELLDSFQLVREGTLSEIDAIAVSGDALVIVGREGAADMIVRKIEKTGQTVWSDKLDAQEGESANSFDSGCGLAIDAEGNALALGQMNGALAGHSSKGGVVLRKYAPGGSPLWTKVFEEDGCASGGAVVVNGDGIYVATNAGARRLDADGKVVWEKSVWPLSYTTGAVSADGALIVAGYTRDVPPSEGDGVDLIVRKYDAQGVELWTRQVGSPATEDAHALGVDSTGRVYLGGGCSDWTGKLTGVEGFEGLGAFVMQLKP